MLSPSSIIVASHHQVSSDLAGEAVSRELNAGEYYGLNQVGASVWDLIQQPRTVGQMRDALLQKYDVERACCERNLDQLLNDLNAAGLIDIQSHDVSL